MVALAHNSYIYATYFKLLIMSELQNLFYDNVCNVVFDTHGEMYPIKEHRNWKFVNIGDKKIGISKLPLKMKIFNFDDFVFHYVFGEMLPCNAMGYYVLRKMSGRKISLIEYKNNHIKN